MPGTEDARRLTATVPAKEGTDPAEVKSDSLDLLRDNGDTLTVVVAAPQRKGDDDLDPKAVVDSCVSAVRPTTIAEPPPRRVGSATACWRPCRRKGIAATAPSSRAAGGSVNVCPRSSSASP